MDEEKLFSKDVRCVVLPQEGNFCIGRTYHFVYNRMNDIVWFTCQDDNNIQMGFHENGWQKYFVEI